MPRRSERPRVVWRVELMGLLGRGHAWWVLVDDLPRQAGWALDVRDARDEADRCAQGWIRLLEVGTIV